MFHHYHYQLFSIIIIFCFYFSTYFSTFPFFQLLLLFSPLLSTHILHSPSADIREAAFVYAITAAGVVHAVTQACSMGDLLQCGCISSRGPPADSRATPQTPEATQEGPWEWGGCGDDVEFGYQISKQFTDSWRKRGKSDIRTLIDLHNNEAGRLVCLCLVYQYRISTSHTDVLITVFQLT